MARFAQPVADDLDLAVGVSGREDYLSVRVAPFTDARQHELAAELYARLVWTLGPSALALRAAAGGERLDVDGGPSHARGKLALSAADDLTLGGGRLHLAPALRWDVDGPLHGLSAKLGASLHIAGPVSLRANAGRSFRPPSFGELYLEQGLLAANPTLRPEESWSADAGAAADGRLGFASVTAFGQLYRDAIVYEPDSFRRLKPFNDGKASAAGVEVDAASAPRGPWGLAASAAYTLLATETLRGEDAVLGKTLPHRARHRLFARLAAGRGAVDGHAEAQYVSAQYQDLRNLIPIPDALSFNVGAALRVWRRPDARVHLEIRNVLGDRSLQDGFGNPLPGRMVLVTLRVAGGKDGTTP
jgi:iron complex outermembrane receptor protein